ncbi:alanine--tRNA ligase [Elysia marginata]|uniref:alanine--tRNA ligase n=1 Tax=Elysia marginata TaxID=1093978 RepID=A0AAV4GE65_9GAST|nr:alanine--tRNA ligase [Elysia marginata]
MLLLKESPKWCKPCLVLMIRRNSSWTSRQVRSTFIDFFSSQGHQVVPSSSVIPKKGEGTYFTNAGMNQFKPIFLGECAPSNPLAALRCATNSQKCIRVGGKHNDLEDVGHDFTHHTFFEMLGNWSFGDYFKKQACSLAFDLLTNCYRIPPERLYFTYFAGDPNLGVPADEECRDSCAYPELELNKSKVCDIASSAIDYHDKQRDVSAKSFNKMSARLKGIVLSGETIHSLEKGHYGSAMSLEVISELAASRGLELDLTDYEQLKEVEKVSSSRPVQVKDCVGPLVREMVARGVPATVDSFKYNYRPLNESLYDFSALELRESQVCGLSSDGEIVKTLSQAEQGEVILDSTCFYAEGGGQESDAGMLTSETGQFTVTKAVNRDGFIVHVGHVTDGHISSGQAVKALVFNERRLGCMRNHTATHLLNTALERIIPASQQEGSSISPDKLTFDFLALAICCGKLLSLLSGMLQTLDLQNPGLGNSWSRVTQAAHQLHTLIQDRQERLRHSLKFVPECDTSQQARLDAMIAEADKSLIWTESVLALENLKETKQGTDTEDDLGISILQAIVSILRKGKDLDLVPKSAREEAHSCLHRLEHKVTEAVNEKMLAKLHRNIDNIVTQFHGKESLGFSVPKEFAPRQTVVETCEEIMDKLEQLSPTKGKQVSVAGGKLDVFVYTMNNRTKQGCAVNESLLQSCLPYHWFPAR